MYPGYDLNIFKLTIAPQEWMEVRQKFSYSPAAGVRSRYLSVSSAGVEMCVSNKNI